MQEVLLLVSWYILLLVVPLFFIGGYFFLKKEAHKYNATKNSKYVFKMIGVIFVVVLITIQYITYVTFLGDIKSMRELGFEWREVDSIERGFYKHIKNYDIYVNLVHSSGIRGYRNPYTEVRIFAYLENFDLNDYFCNQGSLNDFVSSRGFASGGGFDRFNNGHPSDKCFNSSIEKAIEKLPLKKHKYTGWSGLPSFIPLPIGNDRYYIWIENYEINLDTFEEELSDFIRFFDVLTRSGK